MLSLRNALSILGVHPKPDSPGWSIEPVASEADHFMLCPACGGWFDMRDLKQVIAHDEPMPHPSGGQPQ